MDHHDGWSLTAPVEIVDVCPVSTGHKARDWLWLRRARRSGKREGENNYGGTKKGSANERPFQHLASQAHNPELHRIRGTTRPVGGVRPSRPVARQDPARSLDLALAHDYVPCTPR